MTEYISWIETLNENINLEATREPLPEGVRPEFKFEDYITSLESIENDRNVSDIVSRFPAVLI